MADRPVVFGENLFSITQFPKHVITAEEEPAGFEAYRVADGRRSALDYATATTADSDWWVKVVCDRVRPADMVALDRGHNLAGKAVALQCSDDDAVWTDVVIVSALQAMPGGTLDAPLVPSSGVWGCRTEEGAWLCRFPYRAAKYWRLLVTAMGAGLKPQIVGLQVGLSYSPDNLPRPASPDGDELVVEETLTAALWAGTGPPGYRRGGSIRVQLTDYFEYELARYQLQGVFGRRRPTWLIHDEGQADRAAQAVRPPGQLGLGAEQGWAYPSGAVAWVEHEPKPEG